MGIWLIYYSISSEHRTEYLHWFEGQHIDEKLARPGYDWACHYELVESSLPENTRYAYIAMFGAESTRIFFDPSPAQIKPNQDELTRRMIGYRVNAKPAILSQEWSEQSTMAQQSTTNAGINSEYIRLSIFADTVDDQEIVSWCAQSLFPTLTASEQVSTVHKCLASFGSNRHIVLEEHTGNAAPNEIWQNQAVNLAFDPVIAKRRVFRN